MNDLLRKGINGIYYFSFNLGYYFSAGYFTCKKEYVPFLNELKEFKYILYRKPLYMKKHRLQIRLIRALFFLFILSN